MPRLTDKNSFDNQIRKYYDVAHDVKMLEGFKLLLVKPTSKPYKVSGKNFMLSCLDSKHLTNGCGNLSEYRILAES